MDELVRAALRKWPQVPDCRGWLGLDARGRWWMRDAAVQAAGPFPAHKGDEIRHPALRAFIARNYTSTPEGAFYFQNGPQRVWVSLEAAPYIWRVGARDGTSEPIHSHTGEGARVTQTGVDEAGRLYVRGEWLAPPHAGVGVVPPCVGLVHSLDMGEAAQALLDGAWPTPVSLVGDWPARWGFQRG